MLTVPNTPDAGRCRFSSLFAIVVSMTVTSLGAAGCGAVLTHAQAETVKDFSHANEAYSKLGPSVLRAYEEVHFVADILDVSTIQATDEPTAFRMLETSLQTSAEIEQDAATLQSALQILDRYARLMGVLAGESDLETLDETAGELGADLDKSIGVYNTLPAGKAHPLPAVGAVAAGAIRAAGGVWIRHRQLLYLRKFASVADPVIQRLAADVSTLLTSFSAIDGHLEADRQRIEATLRTYYATHGPAISASDLVIVAETLRKQSLAIGLAKDVLAASARLGSAHALLKKALEPEASLGEARAEIQVLFEEIQAADQVRKKIGP